MQCQIETQIEETGSVDMVNFNDNDIIFTIKETKLSVPVVTVSAKYNQKLLKQTNWNISVLEWIWNKEWEQKYNKGV